MQRLSNEDLNVDIPAELLEQNMGKGKVFSGGPICTFNGKEIPAYVTNSESGGITPEILVGVLSHLDKHSVAERQPGDPPPCMLVDGWIPSKHSISLLH